MFFNSKVGFVDIFRRVVPVRNFSSVENVGFPEKAP